MSIIISCIRKQYNLLQIKKSNQKLHHYIEQVVEIAIQFAVTRIINVTCYNYITIIEII